MLVAVDDLNSNVSPHAITKRSRSIRPLTRSTRPFFRYERQMNSCGSREYGSRSATTAQLYSPSTTIKKSWCVVKTSGLPA